MPAHTPPADALDFASRLRAAIEAPSLSPLSRGMAVHALTQDGYLIEGMVQNVQSDGVEVLFNSRLRQHVKETLFAFDRLARPDEKVAVIMECGRNIEGQAGRHFRLDRSDYPQEHLPAHMWPYESYCVELQKGILLQGASKSPGVLRFLDQLPSKSVSAAALPHKEIEFGLPGQRESSQGGVHGFMRATFGRGTTVSV